MVLGKLGHFDTHIHGPVHDEAVAWECAYVGVDPLFLRCFEFQLGSFIRLEYGRMPEHGIVFGDVVGIGRQRDGSLHDFKPFARGNDGEIVRHLIRILEGEHHLLPGLSFKTRLVVLQPRQGADGDLQGRGRNCNCRK